MNDVYNAAKHGFTVLAEEAYIAFSEKPTADPAAALFSHSGPSLELLTSDRIDRSTIRWSSTTVWTSPERSWFMAMIAIQLLEATWRVGRARYMGVALDSATVLDFRPVDVQRAAGIGGADRFRRTLFFERPQAPS